jgi:hypothetical protein
MLSGYPGCPVTWGQPVSPRLGSDFAAGSSGDHVG